MQNPTGFNISKADLNRAYLRLIPWVIIGLVAPVVLGLTNPLLAINTAAFIAILIGGVYWYTLRYKWVHLASSGIQGLTPTGAKVSISWLEPVQLERRTAFAGIACISVQPLAQSAALMLPSSIAATQEFKAALEQVAPPSHPLRSVGTNVL